MICLYHEIMFLNSLADIIFLWLILTTRWHPPKRRKFKEILLGKIPWCSKSTGHCMQPNVDKRKIRKNRRSNLHMAWLMGVSFWALSQSRIIWRLHMSFEDYGEGHRLVAWALHYREIARYLDKLCQDFQGSISTTSISYQPNTCIDEPLQLKIFLTIRLCSLD